MKIKITAESTCDLTPELRDKHNIRTVPLHIVRSDGKEFSDGVDIQPADLFRYSEDEGLTCQTACISVGEYEAVFREERAKYDAVIHVSLGSKISACHQNAVLAAAELEGVYVVDSQNLSTGMGHMVLDAAELAEAGTAPEEIVRILTERAPRVETSFVINTLKYMRQGGRCSAVAALGANLLKILPCIELRNGSMGVGKKYRGSFEKVILQYVRERLSGRDDIDHRRIIITDCMVPEATRRAVRELVESLGHFEAVYQTSAGCTISNHCGPCCLGILFFRK